MVVLRNADLYDTTAVPYVIKQYAVLYSYDTAVRAGYGSNGRTPEKLLVTNVQARKVQQPLPCFRTRPVCLGTKPFEIRVGACFTVVKI